MRVHGPLRTGPGVCTLNAEVQQISPYSDNTTPETQLGNDSVYDDGGASSGLFTLTALGDSVSDGCTATLTVGVSGDQDRTGRGGRRTPPPRPCAG